MLTAFPNLIGNLLQIPAGLWSERMKDKRILPIVGGYLARSTWALLAIVPFLVPPQYRVGVVILLATFRILAANIGVPAWTALQAELIPRAIRGRYYANRNIVCNISAVAATVLATVLLTLRFPLNFQLIFGGAAALGLTAPTSFPPSNLPKVRPSLGRVFPFGPRCRRFGGSAHPERFQKLCAQLSDLELRGEPGQLPFRGVFCGRFRGAAGFWAVFSGVNLATQVLVQRYWGRLADVFGQKNVMLASGIGAVFLPLLWWGTRSTWFP